MIDDIQKFFTDNSVWIYYAFGVIGIVYTTLLFLNRKIKNSHTYNLLKLIFEVPSTIIEIKDDQKAIFREIKLQNKFINSILDTLELAQFLCDAEGKCIKVNSKWISLTGLSEEEAKGHNWLLSIHFEDRDRVHQKWVNMIKDNIPFEEVFRYRHRVTETVTKVKCTATDVEDENNNRIFILGLSRVL